MKHFIPSLLLLTFLPGCGENTSNTTIPTDSGTLKESEMMDTCECKVLDTDTTGMHYLNDKPYTGTCINYYPETQTKYIEKSILNGKIHGKVTYYSKKGDVLIEEVYEAGNKKRSGNVDVLTCQCSELEKQETHYPAVPYRYLLDDIPYTGTCEEYYPDSDQLYMRVSYKKGVLDGHTIYYNKDGSTLLIERYENGELVRTIH